MPVATKAPTPFTYNQGTIIMILLVVAAGSPFIVQKEIRPKWEPPRWEYMIESPMDISLPDDLKLYGQEGWELVTARRAVSGEGDFA